MVRFIVAALAALAVTLAAPGIAQNYPSKPIRLIVPFPPGGGTDSVSRLVAQELQKSTGWTIVVENKAGAGGMIGLQEAARARPDGYDIVMAQVDNMVIAPAVQRTGTMDPVKDLTPVIQVASSPFLFMSSVDSKYKTLNDWVSEAKAKPNTVTYGTAGYGTFTHLAVELLQKAGNFTAVQVPYKGAAPAMIDIVSGQIHLMFASTVSSAPYIKNGTLRVIAVTGARRSPVFPDVPTISESGVPGFEWHNTYSLFAPAGTARAIIRAINLVVKQGINTPETMKYLAADGAAAAAPATPEEFKAKFAKDYDTMEKLVKATNLRIN